MLWRRTLVAVTLLWCPTVAAWRERWQILTPYTAALLKAQHYWTVLCGWDGRFYVEMLPPSPLLSNSSYKRDECLTLPKLEPIEVTNQTLRLYYKPLLFAERAGFTKMKSFSVWSNISKPGAVGKYELCCMHCTDVALQDCWVLKFSFSRRLPLCSNWSCFSLNWPPSCSGYLRGSVEVCRGRCVGTL